MKRPFSGFWIFWIIVKLILIARPYELPAGNYKSHEKRIIFQKIYKFWLFNNNFFKPNLSDKPYDAIHKRYFFIGFYLIRIQTIRLIMETQKLPVLNHDQNSKDLWVLRNRNTWIIKSKRIRFFWSYFLRDFRVQSDPQKGQIQNAYREWEKLFTDMNKWIRYFLGSGRLWRMSTSVYNPSWYKRQWVQISTDSLRERLNSEKSSTRSDNK